MRSAAQNPRMEQDVNLCPRCGGHVITIGRRSWCIKPYHLGGCGLYWTTR